MQENTNSLSPTPGTLNRRSLCKSLTAGAVVSAIPLSSDCGAEQGSAPRGVKNGRINQSVGYGCVARHGSVEETCEQAKRLGCRSIS